MPSTLPDQRPTGVEDATTLRWALRSDGTSGFLFLAWHQPHFPLETYRGARFEITLDEGRSLTLPSTPIDIPYGTLARWPLNLHGIAWATASALTLLPGAVPTLVLTQDAGIPVEVAVTPDDVRQVTPGLDPIRLETAEGPLDVLVLDAATAATAWVEGDRVLISADELFWGPDGRVSARAAATPHVQAYDPSSRTFQDLVFAPPTGSGTTGVAPVPTELIRPAGPVPAEYGKHDGRQSAPSPEVFADLAAVHRLRLPAWVDEPDLDLILEITWAGDVAELHIDGRPATDRFWDGARWLINLRDAGYTPGSEVTLHLLPLATVSAVHLPADARDRLLSAEGQLLALDTLRVTGRLTWHEAR